MGEGLLMNAAEAARYVGISVETAYKLIKSGEWPTITVCKRAMVSRVFLDSKYAILPTASLSENSDTPSQQLPDTAPSPDAA